MRGVDIAPFHEFYKQATGKEPGGRLWEVYKTIIALNGAMQRMIVMPPGSPPDAVRALQDALRKLNSDKQYAEEALSTFGFVPEWIADAGVQERVRSALVLSPDVKKFLRSYIENPPRN